DMHLIKLDLRQTEPPQGAAVSSATPTLAWTAYPSATSYKVYLAPERGSAVYVNEVTTAPSFAVRQPLRNCEYRWRVEAYTSAKVPIAQAGEFIRCTVTGHATSCRLTISAPLGGPEIAGSGIVLQWVEHPQATMYKLYIAK